MKSSKAKELGFSLKDGSKSLYTHPKYGVKLDLEKLKASYPKELKVHDKSSSNLNIAESWVVLECVLRLLKLGYEAKSIELEKPFELGRKEKGKLDIYIKDSEGKAYAMIECKTAKEYESTLKEMKRLGKNQLFSYYQQDKDAKILILYAYDFEDSLQKQASIIASEEMKNASNLEELKSLWKGKATNTAFFETKAFSDIEEKPLYIKDLLELDKDSGTGIYNDFAELLREHSVSDKGNAFNKLFNLFLCKIIDEDKLDDEKCEFFIASTKSEQSYKELAKRLNHLYKKGMKKFLNKAITDYDDSEIRGLEKDAEIFKIFEELRLYKNNEFAFIDVYNKESFLTNMKIVCAVVELLQNFKLRYTHKQQFLGEFFELLLNSGFKQESGQFFTPTPLAEFIVSCLPLKEYIEEKDELSSLIDFACGSGHFLTEAMDALQALIDKDEIKAKSKNFKKALDGYKVNNYDFAKEYIYGLDNDYRLIKTTKVACFLNGDGEANIIHENGLAHFGSKNYKDKLAKPANFDILLANPPYSVSGFYNQLSLEDKKGFSLTPPLRVMI